MATIPDLDAIVAAIDAGDTDQVTMLAWADALEEQGDARAAGLRTRHRPQRLRPYVIGDRSGWEWFSGSPTKRDGACVDSQLFARLVTLGDWFNGSADNCIAYPTRSAAFLALASALTEVVHAQ